MDNSSLPAYKNSSLSVEERVTDLLGRMTLEEKVTQMSILGWPTALEPDTIPKLLKNGTGGIIGLGNFRTPRETARFYNKIQHHLIEKTRLGIPALSMNEAVHGCMARGNTSFPQAIALASTWNTILIQQVFNTVAKEMRSHGGNHALSPVLDLARDPRWGRTEETYGEDPYLVSRMGVAAIRGLQGETLPIGPEHVIATTKHFAVHGQPEGGVNCSPANYGEREIREYFLKPFQAAITEAKAQCVMASYNEIDGIPCHVNDWLLGRVLRQEWAFQGFITSDGLAIHQLVDLHHIADDPAEAAQLVLQAGVDFELDNCFPTLLEQVHEGQVDIQLIDTAVGRILRAKFSLGLFENPFVDMERTAKLVNSQPHRQLALQTAHQAAVLLKNENHLLPLDPAAIRHLAVIGPNAADLHLGGYSVDPMRGVSLLDGLRERLGDSVKISYAEGCRITEGVQGWQAWWQDEVIPGDQIEDDQRIAVAVDVARQADVIILALGENEGICREGWDTTHLGDRDSLDLPGRQNELAAAILAVCKPVVVLLFNGRPLSVNLLAEKADAILECWYLGQETGLAVTDLLTGVVNPSGKLPITFPRNVGQIPTYYYHKPTARRGYVLSDITPLYPFGHGMSYTTFSYSTPRLSAAQIGPGETTKVSVEVTNTGNRTGDEVVQLYIHDLSSNKVTHPIKLLKGFQRITLQPGETKTVTFLIGREQMEFLGEALQPVVEPGGFEVLVGGSSANTHSVILKYNL